MISTNSLRFEFDRVLSAMEVGRELTLTYRNRPLAKIVPIKHSSVSVDDDPIFTMHEKAEDIGSVANVDIDRLVYGA